MTRPINRDEEGVLWFMILTRISAIYIIIFLYFCLRFGFENVDGPVRYSVKGKKWKKSENKLRDN